MERVQRERKTECPTPDPVPGTREEHGRHHEREAGTRQTRRHEEAGTGAPEPRDHPARVADDNGVFDRVKVIREQRRVDVPGEEATRNVAQRIVAAVPVERGFQDRGGNQRHTGRTQCCAERDRRTTRPGLLRGPDRSGHAKRTSAMVPTTML